MEKIGISTFVGWPKMARLSREVIITEKIDGTCSCVCIGENGEFLVGSRTRWITPENDNHGFARWAYDNVEELLKLGPGRHFGEWWGKSINRGYGLKEKRFSLFNVLRWEKEEEKLPECCSTINILWRGIFNTDMVDRKLEELKIFGSVAAPGYYNPEGVVVYHIAGNIAFKKTIEKDERGKEEG